MAVRTEKLAQAAATVLFYGVIYTVPAGHRTIVKEIVQADILGVGGIVVVFAGNPASGVTIARYTLAPTDYKRDERWTVLDPGDTIVWYAAPNTGGDLRIIVSGTELVL